MDSRDGMSARGGIHAFKQFLLAFEFPEFVERLKLPVKLTESRRDIDKKLRLQDKNNPVIAIIGPVGDEEKDAFIDDAVAKSKGAFLPKGDSASLQTNSPVRISAFQHYDNSRSILLVQCLASVKNEKIHKVLESILLATRRDNSAFKLSGLIYIQNISTSQPSRPSRTDFKRLDEDVEGHNIAVVTTGWNDDKSTSAKKNMENHQLIVKHWTPFLDYDTFNIIRLSAGGKTSKDFPHDSLGVINLLLEQVGKPTEIEQEETGGRLFADAQSTDLVVLVMGPSGVGKSTFINHLVGRSVASVNHSLESKASAPQHFILSNFIDRTRRIVLLEIPGFGNATLDDEDVLRGVAERLKDSDSKKIPIAGIIYMHDISQARMDATVKQNLDVASKMIGRNATRIVVVVTTKWGLVMEEVEAVARQTELRETHWKDMESAGARFLSFKDSHESAEEIIRSVLEPDGDSIRTAERGVPVYLRIQEELFGDYKRIRQTEAAKLLLQPVDKAIKAPQNVKDLERQFPGVQLSLLEFNAHSFKGLEQVISRAKPTRFRKILRKNRSRIPSKSDLVFAITGIVRNDQKRAFIGDASVKSEGALLPKANITSHADSIAGICAFKHPDDASRSIFFLYLPNGKSEEIHEAVDAVVKLSLILSGDSGLKLSGLIHVEDISTLQPTEPSNRDFNRLRQCVEDVNVTVVTTGWDDTASEARREEMIHRHSQVYKYWKPLVESDDVTVVRLSEPGKTSRDISHDSWDVIQGILDKPINKAREFQRGNAEGVSLVDAQNTDLVIPVMGPTGVGKSTFINHIAGEPVALVGHTLTSETFSPQPVVVPFPADPARRIILVDTPGFNDTTLGDEEILRRIAEWLTNTYNTKIPLAGIIYLHDISQTRMLGTVKKNLEVFSKMIGQNAARNVVLVTTKWGLVQKAAGIRREDQLRADYWNHLESFGARFYSFKDTPESAEEVVRIVLAADDMEKTRRVIPAEIQIETVDEKKRVPDTEAAKALVHSLEDALQKMQQECEEAIGDEKKELQRKIAAITKQIRPVKDQSNIISKLSPIVKDLAARLNGR